MGIEEKVGEGSNKTVQLWMSRISEAKEREKNWRKNAKDAVEIYECEESDKIPYNILYANTQILAPSIYNQPPKPVVKRRYNDEDPVAMKSSIIVERLLKYFIDCGDPSYPSIDQLLASATLEGLVPGRGLTRSKYDAELSKKKGEDEQEVEEVSYETICGEEIPWGRFCHGYAKKWAEVPWGCIEHYKTKDEIVEMFGKEIAEELEYTFESEALKAEQSKDTLLPGSTIKLARLFEIWDKEDKKRIILAQGYDDVLDESDDPLELDGFYPWPEPMSFFLRISGLTPQLLYKVYENQAKELNRVTIRINRIIEALKVRGFYDGSIDGLKALLTSDDNTLLPVQNVDKLEGKSLDNVLWFMPLS